MYVLFTCVQHGVVLCFYDPLNFQKNKKTILDVFVTSFFLDPSQQ